MALFLVCVYGFCENVMFDGFLFYFYLFLSLYLAFIIAWWFFIAFIFQYWGVASCVLKPAICSHWIWGSIFQSSLPVEKKVYYLLKIVRFNEDFNFEMEFC